MSKVNLKLGAEWIVEKLQKSDRSVQNIHHFVQQAPLDIFRRFCPARVCFTTSLFTYDNPVTQVQMYAFYSVFCMILFISLISLTWEISTEVKFGKTNVIGFLGMTSHSSLDFTKKYKTKKNRETHVNDRDKNYLICNINKQTIWTFVSIWLSWHTHSNEL